MFHLNSYFIIGFVYFKMTKWANFMISQIYFKKAIEMSYYLTFLSKKSYFYGIKFNFNFYLNNFNFNLYILNFYYFLISLRMFALIYF
jgi:hypothetical protein